MTHVSLLVSALVAAAAANPIYGPNHSPTEYHVAMNNARRYAPLPNGEVNTRLLLEDLNKVSMRYKGVPLPNMATDSLRKRAGTTGTIPLTDQVEAKEDELYYGLVSVGTSPKQSFTIDFDTGSADFFVPGPSCTTAAGCTGTTKYSQHGTDEKNTTTVVYGSGDITGENYFDTVCAAGLCASHTNVVSLTTAMGFSGSASEGLMGMGFSTIAESGQPTFFENLMSEGKVAANEFAFYLGRGVSNTQKLSQLTLGGIDSSKYTGSFTKVPVTDKGYWQVALAGLAVSGKPVGALTKGQAAIDTGTTIILGPTTAITDFFTQIPGSVPLPGVSGSPTLTLFAYPCNTKAIGQIIFAGKKFDINKLDFSLGTLSSDLLEELAIDEATFNLAKRNAGVEDASLANMCISAVGADDISPTENLYVVGDSFLKNYYSVFNYDNGASVSFAKAKPGYGA